MESLSFSPAELVSGHNLRGPLKVLTEKFMESKKMNVLDFVSHPGNTSKWGPHEIYLGYMGHGLRVGFEVMLGPTWASQNNNNGQLASTYGN